MREEKNSTGLDEVKTSWEFEHLDEQEAESACLRRNAQRALEKLDGHLKREPDSRILDFGSGFGFFLAAAKEKGWDTYGIEPLPARAVYARTTYRLKIITEIIYIPSG